MSDRICLTALAESDPTPWRIFFFCVMTSLMPDRVKELRYFIGFFEIFRVAVGSGGSIFIRWKAPEITGVYDSGSDLSDHE